MWFQIFEISKNNSEVSKSNSNILVENYFFHENYVTSEGAVSHNVVNYQPLSIARYQVSFFANKILWVTTNIHVVTNAFKGRAELPT